MLLGQELKFKNKLCNLKLGTFFSALPGLGAFGLSARFNHTVRIFFVQVPADTILFVFTSFFLFP